MLDLFHPPEVHVSGAKAVQGVMSRPDDGAANRKRKRNNMRRYRARDADKAKRRAMLDNLRAQLRRALDWQARIPAIEREIERALREL